MKSIEKLVRMSTDELAKLAFDQQMVIADQTLQLSSVKSETTSKRRLYPTGHAILIKVKPPLDKKSLGGIILASEQSKDKVNHQETEGVVLWKGEDCYNDKKSHWCEVGDVVNFSNNAARVKNDTGMWGSSDIDEGIPSSLRLVMDIDILAVYRDSEVMEQKRSKV